MTKYSYCHIRTDMKLYKAETANSCEMCEEVPISNFCENKVYMHRKQCCEIAKPGDMDKHPMKTPLK